MELCLTTEALVNLSLFCTTFNEIFIKKKKNQLHLKSLYEYFWLKKSTF